VRLLLDTHAFLWWLDNSTKLSRQAKEAIAAPESEVNVSAVSAWEIAIKKAIGKLKVPDDLKGQLARHRFTPLPVSFDHAMLAGSLPRHHDDPFDRMLIAQAEAEGMTLVTRDPHIRLYDVPTLAA
jgi:PIN domain nuclease of toxin-antitoxin system